MAVQLNMSADPAARTALELELLLEALYRGFGEDYRRKPRPALVASLARALERHGLPNLSALIERVLHDPVVAEAVLSALASDAAMMFGCSDYQQQVRSEMGPRLCSFPAPNVWLSECASPEQLLTLLILLDEDGVLDKATVYATHRSSRLLTQVREGCVPLLRLPEYEEMYRRAGGVKSLARYGQAQGEHFRFSDALLEHVVCAEYNLGTDTSFNEFQWIEARDSLQALEGALRQRAFVVYHNSLHHYGLIGLGDAPELHEAPLARAYRPLRAGSALYRKA